jgi:fatty acid amide hydrolase
MDQYLNKMTLPQIGLGVLISSSVLCVGISLVKTVKHLYLKCYWNTLAEKYMNERDNEIKEFLEKHENEISKEKIEYIVHLTLTELAGKIKKREISSYEAVLAYSINSAKRGRELNLIADVNFKIALEEAKLADNELEKRTEVGSLHGVPISIKDHINVNGFRTTCGMISMHGNIANRDSYIVEILRNCGAIPFIKGNVPQGCASIESSNFLYGTAKNPHNPNKTPGGSSGGDAGLVASYCSPCGIGSDVGGSIRIPAAFCGIYGFKPSPTRISIQGVPDHIGRIPANYPNFKLILGPLGRSVDDLELVCRSLFGQFAKDPYINRNNLIDLKKIDTNILTIGYFYDFPLFQPSKAITDPIDNILSKLTKQGHMVKKFDSKDLNPMVYTGLGLMYGMDALTDIETSLKGESFHPQYKSIIKLVSMPKLKKFILSKYYYLMGEYRLAMNMTVQKMNKSDFIKNCQELLRLKNEVMEYWMNNKFDIILCPAYSLPASNFNTVNELPKTSFEVFANILDLPAGCIPIDVCSENNLDYTDSYNDSMTQLIKDNLKTSKGLPTSLQVIALPDKDELCLKAMKMIDELK